MGSFAMQLGAFEKKAGVNMKTVVQKIGMETFKRVIFRTPVDKGHLRANWGCQIGSPCKGSDPSAVDSNGNSTAAKAMAIVQAWNGQGSIFLCNNLPYSIAIEYGHSTVKAPAGMVRVVIAEMGGVAEQLARATA